MTGDYELRYYKALPIEGLCSPLMDRLNSDTVPPRHRANIDHVKDSIQVNGMRNPLTVEWFAPDPSREVDWYVRIGNNRLCALYLLGYTTAPCLVIVPVGVQGPAGTYELLSVEAALALFDAEHPWWHSYILRKLNPEQVPEGA